MNITTVLTFHIISSHSNMYLYTAIARQLDQSHMLLLLLIVDIISMQRYQLILLIFEFFPSSVQHILTHTYSGGARTTMWMQEISAPLVSLHTVKSHVGIWSVFQYLGIGGVEQNAGGGVGTFKFPCCLVYCHCQHRNLIGSFTVHRNFTVSNRSFLQCKKQICRRKVDYVIYTPSIKVKQKTRKRKAKYLFHL